MKLIVAAMPEEVKDIKGHDVLVTGIGKVNAAHYLTEAILKNEVKAIYNVGFAGASHHYEVGDVVIIKSAKYHDFDLTFFGYEKGQVPHMPVAFKSNDKLFKEATSKFKNAKQSNLYTGDYFMTEHVDLPYVVDMEGTSLYQVAYIKKIPIISIKIISDIIGMEDHYENYKSFEKGKGSALIASIVDELVKE